jgi:hypothetical protein
MAQPQYADNVSVVSTSTGTGSLTLAGAVTGHQTFGTAFGTSGNTEVFYGIKATTGEWETGIGTFLGVSNALQRDTVLDSSTGAKVNFPAGSKTVYCPQPALVPWTFQSRRASDITLALRTIVAQSEPALQTYTSAGAAAFKVMPDGLVVLAAGAGEMLRIGMEPSGVKWVAVRNDLLGAPGNDGIRWRLTGTGGTTGFLQWSSGDTGFAQLQPSTGELRFINNVGDGGATFLQGVAIRNNDRTIGGVTAGHLAFDCAGETANTGWDIGPAHNGGSGTHTIRIGRRSGSNTKVNVEIATPNTTTAKVRLGSDGMIMAGDYYIGGNTSGAVTPSQISVKDNQPMVLRGGLTTSDSPIEFHDSVNTSIAEISPAGTSSPKTTTVITRTKGDTRYQAVSSLRFKEHVFEAEDLAELFGNLQPCGWVWGGEVPEDDERRGTDGIGFIAEDVVKVLPEAGRYIREDGEERKLQSLDPLALIAVLHAKITELEARLAAVEGTA